MGADPLSLSFFLSGSLSPRKNTYSVTYLADPLGLSDTEIRSLRLTPEDLNSLNRLVLPLSNPPSHDFHRSVGLNVDFGFVPSDLASLPFRRSPGGTYPLNPVKQPRYESFLLGQTGEAQEHYFQLLKTILEFSDLYAEFEAVAWRAAAKEEVGEYGRGSLRRQ